MNKIVVAVVLLLGIANALPQPNPHSPQGSDGGSKHLGFDHKHINHRGISGNRGIKGFGRNHHIGKREASAEPNPRSPNGFAVGGFQSVQPARPIKGGGLGGYHGFKGFGGVHHIGKREASAEPSPRSPNGFAVGGFQSVQPARPIKGGGLGGYHGFKGFGGVHHIGKREASAEPSPRSPNGFAVGGFQSVQPARPIKGGGLGGYHGFKGFGGVHHIGKREASAEPSPRSPNGFAVGGFQSVQPARPIKGGGLGGYHGFKGFGGVHHIGKREASAEPSPRSPSGFAVGGFQSVPPARPIKGGGLGGYHGFKGFGGVHTIG